MENKNNEVEKIEEETKETKMEKVKTFCRKIKKSVIRVGVVVLAFAAGAATDAVIRSRKDSSEESPQLSSGTNPWGENENMASEENVTVEEPINENLEE